MAIATRLAGGFLVFAIGFFPVMASQPTEVALPGELFKGTTLPKPPEQGQPWNPSASPLSERWITATKELYLRGFADPRGCEYREVKLTCGSSLWGGSELVAAHAWVLPAGKDSKPNAQRFAVTWTGIVYPVVSVGPRVDLSSDVDSLMKAFAKGQNDHVYTGHGFTEGHPEYAEGQMRLPPESELVAHDFMFALKSCLLLRLGEGELAARVWNAWRSANPQLMSESQSPGGDPYIVLAWEWSWALYDHAIAAHLRGDDVVALEAAKTLKTFKESVPQVARKRGIPQRKSLANDVPLDYLPLYDPPETLLEDAARRVKAGPIRRALDVGLASFPNQSDRIAALVSDLEDVSAGREYKDGDVPLAPPYITYGRPPVNPLKTSPVVLALIEEGEPAVEPLLQCLIDGHRLTRVAGVGHHEISGDLLPLRDLITVNVAAYTALCGILHAEHFGPSTAEPYYNGKSQEQRLAVAKEIRRRFDSIKGQTRENAWISVLSDRDLTSQAWLEVAEQIVAPAEGTPAIKAQPDSNADSTEPSDIALPMNGEILRKRQNPSLSELLAERSDDAAQDGPGFSGDLAICLGKWDSKASIPVLERRITEWRRAYRDKVGPGNSEAFVHLVEVALQAGSEKAALGYTAWLRSIRPDDMPFFQLSIFMPVWRHPENAKLAELARWLFLADDSPWHPIQDLKPLSSHEMICSPLVGVPAFRELLKRELDDVAPLGEVEYRDGSMTLHVRNAGMGYSSEYAPDMKVKADGQQPLRTCDFYASQISRLEGAPRYELYWPQGRRDAVQKEMAQFLDRWGNCFRDRNMSLQAYYWLFSAPRFSLSLLLQPSTAEDVAAGRAIFSLRDHADVQVRTVPLKPRPHIARWKTLERFPLQTPGVAEWPKDRKSRDQKVWAALPKEPYDREGLIWQAEEVLQDGKWRRYYGFVGNHVIAKVPAEEIDLLDEFSPAHPHRW